LKYKDINAGKKSGPRLASDDVRPPLYPAPQLRHLSDGRSEMLDRHGYVMRPQTSFLMYLRQYYAFETFRDYASKLLDYERVLACDSGGVGLDFRLLSDAYLDKTHTEYIELRGVKLSTFKSMLSLNFRFWKFAQAEGYTEGLVGTNGGGQTFRINVPPEGFSKHPVMRGRVITMLPTMPSHRDIELVVAAGMRLKSSKVLKRRFKLAVQVLKSQAFRRSEGLRLDVSMIPTRKELSRLRQQAKAGKKSWLVPITVERSKRGGSRVSQFPIDLLDELRDFIDVDRPKLLKPSVPCDAVFVSTKTGKRLSNQAFTNEFKCAAHRAAATNPRDFGEISLAAIRPHHCRHRGATDITRGLLMEGIDPTMAMLMAMELVGLRRIDTMSRYLHLAEAEQQEASASYRAAGEKANERTGLDLVRLRKELNGEAA